MNRSTCPQCSRPLTPDAPSGLCPACLLRQGMQATAAADRPEGFTAPTVEELAPLFPQLELAGLIGVGGMGAVYRARQPNLNREVALKILPTARAADPSFAERFVREAQSLARLSHPHVVTVHDFGETHDLYYLIMEFIDGVNLRQLMDEGVETPQALTIVPQVCDALAFAHQHGVVHRDIKP
ncbi:MAG: serine/threonine-protein kinase, partial [Planctomycetota bacterium]